MRLAESGLVQGRVTERIVDECITSIARERPDVPEAALMHRRHQMLHGVRGILVEGYEALIESIALPDDDDRHVVAAAIHAGAQVIVTANLRDFPADVLARHHIEVKHPDDFVVNQIDLRPEAVAEIVGEQAASLRHPPMSVGEVLDRLRDVGLVQTVARLRSLLTPIEP